MTESGDHKPNGFFVTVRDIHTTVLKIDEKLDKELNSLREEISKIKAQLAAQWVIQGILVTIIIFLAQKGLSQ